MGRLDDEVALVTGASSGIGAGLARMLARQGAAVALAARREAALRKVADEIEVDGGTALVAPADIGRDEDLDALVRRVRAELGPVDVLVNAAGVGVYRGRCARRCRRSGDDLADSGSGRRRSQF